jgi:hypothetical protein
MQRLRMRGGLLSDRGEVHARNSLGKTVPETAQPLRGYFSRPGQVPAGAAPSLRTRPAPGFAVATLFFRKRISDSRRSQGRVPAGRGMDSDSTPFGVRPC